MRYKQDPAMSWVRKSGPCEKVLWGLAAPVFCNCVTNGEYGELADLGMRLAAHTLPRVAPGDVSNRLPLGKRRSV
jgi:hypothetical protein